MKSQSGNVMIVADDQLVPGSVAALLRASGFDVTPCDSAEKALAALAVDHFDLVLTDVNMPAMTGTAFRKVVADFKEIYESAR